jgi:hypothetical protein
MKMRIANFSVLFVLIICHRTRPNTAAAKRSSMPQHIQKVLRPPKGELPRDSYVVHPFERVSSFLKSPQQPETAIKDVHCTDVDR